MSIEALLEIEIRDEFEKLTKIETGSESYKTTVDGLTKLLDRMIEIDKSDREFEEDLKNREIDNKLKLEQFKDEKKDRLFRNGIAVAGIIIPSAITIWGTLRSLKFEETGTITTIMGRGFINKLLPKK